MQDITIVQLSQFIAVVGGAIALIFGGLAWVLRALDKRFDERVAQHDSVIDTKLDEKLAPLSRELRPNGGNSMWDKVDNLARQVQDDRAVMNQRHQENSDLVDFIWRSFTAVRHALVKLDVGPDVAEELTRIDHEYEVAKRWRNRAPRD